MSTDIITKTGEALDAIEMGYATKEQVLEAMAFVQQARAQIAAFSQRLEAATIQWIEANGDLEDGDKRYYVGIEKKYKCRDVRLMLEALLNVTGGDLDALNTCLSSSAFKPATTMTTLGEEAAKHFDTEITQDLKTGKPKKALKSASKEFGQG